MDLLLQLSHTPPVTVSPASTVQEAVTLMCENRVGAVAVVDGETLVGVFSERDVMSRVVFPNLKPGETSVRDVMTSPVEHALATDDPIDALERMVKKHIRHLPITDGETRIRGMLSIRNVLQYQLEKTKNEADALEAYFTADGPGG